MVNQIDKEQFEELLKGEKPVVCDFFATWCGPCKMLAPVIEKASEKFGEKAEFVKVDTDECFELAARYGVMSIPLVVIFKGGEPAAKSLGYSTQSEMEDFLTQNL